MTTSSPATGAHIYIITGASGGLGRGIAQTLSKRATEQHPLTLVLVGRNKERLALTEAAAKGPHVRTHAVSGVDLMSLAQDTTSLIMDALASALEQANDQGAPALVALINCAGTISDLSKSIGDYAEQEILAYTQVNFVSYASLTTAFLRDTARYGSARICIVNISSLLAIEAFPNWGLYAAIKAARDQYLKVAAKEHAGCANVKFLNYAPGPLDNDMQADVRRQIKDPEQNKLYTDMHLQKKLVKVADTSRVMCDLLDSWDFESGAHIDYFDVVPA
ncbi:hypothetical protein GGI15_001731 [Coemansia interrupta]|uniref:Sepiapterin reductase n=1 Tax=Coemansia interrupta TaxID=1126814 RepID=A0A9W8HIW7_9FUNG|nr:hypothetical protein GGI15_001731 [Coemansia interrupta]